MRFRGLSVRRLVRVTAVLARHALAASLGARWVDRLGLSGVLPACDLPGPERLRALFEDLGGTFVKLGQLLAAQPDLLPRAYCDALFNLLDRVPALCYPEVDRVVLEELGARPAAVFTAFEPRPLASASIGQVHRARIGAQAVVVKVQRPAARRDFCGDIRLLRLAMALVRRLRLRRLFFLLEPLSELIDWTADELDYRREAAYMEALGRDSRGRRHQRVPRVVEHLTTRRILVMELFDGITVLDYLRAVEAGDEVTLGRLAARGFVAERFARHVIDNFLHQSFVHGLFHADLHPANLMILPGNVVGYLDLGITGTLSPYSRRQLMAITLAYTAGDIAAMSEAFHRVSLADEASAALYREGLERLGEDWYDRVGGSLRLRRSFTLVMLDMLRLCHETGVWAQRDVLKYVRSSIAIDGLICRFAPGIDLGRELEICARHLPAVPAGMTPSPATVVAGSAAGMRRLIAGGRRSASLVARLCHGELPVRAELVGAAAEGGEPSRARTAELALVVVALGLLSRGSGAVPSGSASPALVWLAAEALVLAVACGWMVRRARGSTERLDSGRS